ncbi:allophanate hydrolase [Cohnella nanjingensis]|uniref:Allophanate hydrolase n=1 Tax=Cohnella nanjingensis TaxID=1387779 RepID=A0A7X0VGP0_9BACL|nr:allophanate hydrolase [Cohnella nanjingensis]MBB6673315.1 allophanate hydrolase [Cohnella nanjingensis]
MTPDKLEIPRELTIGWLAEAYAAKALTPAEVVREIVRRAEADAEMNVWIAPPEIGRIQPYLDRLAELDPADAPLWGIPFAIKDNIDLAGVPTTAACAEYAYTPEASAAVVERLVAAGAIPLGKTNLDQFATGLVGTRSPYGETHNALRPELISGGSSSGSAAAVARGHAAFSLGTDTAGSGRVPAALHGLVGFKPSLGAWPVRGVVPACESLDCVTVFAHSLSDALAADGAARGADERDPWSRAIPAPMPALPAKLLLPKETPAFYGPFADAYRSAWLRAAEQAESAGLPVEYADWTLFAEAASVLYEGPWVAERWAGLGEFVEANPGVSFPVTERILRSGSGERYDAASAFRAMHKLQRFKREARGLLQDAVLVMPTCGGTWTRDEVRADPIGANRDMGRYTNHCNLLDLSAVAIPAGEAAPRTPFGITLFALADSEGLLCGAAEALGAAKQTTALAEGGRSAAAGADALTIAAPRAGTTFVAVCGLHMRGLPLERQMRDSGARFIRETETAPKYRLVRLPTAPAKPGLLKQASGGAAIRLEVWEMPLERFGGFAAAIPAPLGIGKVELADGMEVPGFVCEGYAEAGAEDVTAYGGWRSLLTQA